MSSRRITSIAPALFALLYAAGCGEQSLPTTLASTRSTASTIADASRGYKRGFYWLPPMVKAATYAGTFDADAAPTVEICELDGDACAAILATYTLTSGPGGEMVRLNLDEQLYHVNWHTNEFALSTTAWYRVSVRAGGDPNVLLGYADIQPAENGAAVKKIDSDEYIGLVDGRTLPIKFRVETGIVASIRVEPIEAEAEPGATQQFVAIVTDLHGNLLETVVAWASSDDAVATVDQAGLATAVSDGEAAITATADHATGSATFTVLDGTIAIVSAGRGHACAIAADHRGFCWGNNDLGQLGDGTQTTRRTPTAIAGGLTFSTIASGDFHTCGLTTEGAAWCWGNNQSGELGDGGFTRRTSPVAVLGGHTFVSISTGSNNTCALTADNLAYCWGQGFFGGNGNGATPNATSPQPVAGGHLFAVVVSGQQASCGVTTTGQGLCWGNNGGGKLGIGVNGGSRLTPVSISGGHTFTSISVGDNHTCAVTTSGEGYCWGSTQFGRLGNGVGTLGTFTTPQLVLNNITWASISAGGMHSCGVSVTGQAYCWGGGVDGNLGTGGPGSRNTPGLVQGGHTWASITASGLVQFAGGGSVFAFSCGVSVEGQVYCWGSNFQGQLGVGGNTPRGAPTPIAPFPAP